MGLEATRQIIKDKISTKVLILSSYSDDELIQQLTEAGATGYLIKQTAANDLINAIREVHKGNAFLQSCHLKTVARLLPSVNFGWKAGQKAQRAVYLA